MGFQTYGQDKDIRIGPCCSHVNKLQPIFICDGILFKSIEQSELSIDYSTIDSIRIRKDTLFDYKGVAKHYGTVELYTKDSVNTGLKYILNKTNYWLYRYPLASLKINKRSVNWNKKTVSRLMALKPEDIIAIEVVETAKGKYQDGLLKLRIKK
jgi:hypothetical protein